MAGADLSPTRSAPREVVVPAEGESGSRWSPSTSASSTMTPKRMAAARHRGARAAGHGDARTRSARGQPGRGLLQQRPRRPGDHRAPDGAAQGVLQRRHPVLRDLLRQPDLRPGAGLRHLQARSTATAGSTSRCKDRATGKVEITAQNHGFAVDAPLDGPIRDAVRHGRGQPRLPERQRGRRARTHRDDGRVLAFSVQYHPEAAAGPHDSAYLFDRFVELMEVPRRCRRTGRRRRPEPAKN